MPKTNGYSIGELHLITFSLNNATPFYTNIQITVILT